MMSIGSEEGTASRPLVQSEKLSEARQVQQTSRSPTVMATAGVSIPPLVKPYHRPLPKLLPLAPKLPYGASLHAQPSSYLAPQISATPVKKKEKKSTPKAKSPPRTKAKVIEKPVSIPKPVETVKTTPETLRPSKTIPEIVKTVSSITPPSPLPQIVEQEQEEKTSAAAQENTTQNTKAASPPIISPIDVETNPDYIALTSALSLLQTQRSVACNDLIQLKKLKSDALETPELFLTTLRRTGKLHNAPKMQRIARAPMVSWKKYGIENTVVLDHHLSRGLVERQPAFNPVKLFDD